MVVKQREEQEVLKAKLVIKVILASLKPHCHLLAGEVFSLKLSLTKRCEKLCIFTRLN
jgi:hypothetical protein